MEDLSLIQSGKVREIYDAGDNIVIVATNRISCFDVILKNEISDKGKVLTQMSKFWFNMTECMVPNHMITTDKEMLPDRFQSSSYNGNVMLCKKLEMLPIECIVRGYVSGSGWASYKDSGTICGIKLPENLREADKLDEPVYTPSTKAVMGEHDAYITYEQSERYLEDMFPGRGNGYASKLKEYSIALYKKCSEYALSKGIIIADAKFEFGIDKNGVLTLGDELMTPDSSRFWSLNDYEPGHEQLSYDKQYARDWIRVNNKWELPQDIVDKTIEKYKQSYKMLIGESI